MAFFGFGKKKKDKMKTGLEKTRTGFWGGIMNTPTGSVIDDEMYDDLEEQLILADVGGGWRCIWWTSSAIVVRDKGAENRRTGRRCPARHHCRGDDPGGRDGTGRQARCHSGHRRQRRGQDHQHCQAGRLLHRQGKRVMLAAGDPSVPLPASSWRSGQAAPVCPSSAQAKVQNPAAVIFDTVKSATARGYDMVIHRRPSAQQIKPDGRTFQDQPQRQKGSPEASLETLLVLDAITGQNAISQAKEFCKAADATGIILTKLDGTAKGGCVVAVKQRLGLPVRFIGVGEGIDDLLPFTRRALWKSCSPGNGSTKGGRGKFVQPPATPESPRTAPHSGSAGT